MIQNEKLEELFDEWKEAHIKDKLYKFDTPEIKGKYVKIDSFIKDGFCVTDKISKGSVLYISKESNCFDENNLETAKSSKDTYLYDCYNNHCRTTFARRIFDMQDIICERNEISKDNITFMNINKRGGFRSTNMSTLNIYALEFGNYIIREIAIIHPKIIVCCGEGIKRIIEMIYMKNDIICNIPLIDMKHPAYWRMGDEEYKENLKKQLNRINM